MTPVLREATASDSRAVFEVFIESLIELGQRLGVETITGGVENLDALWAKRAPIMTHAAETADRWWVAEENGRLVINRIRLQ